MAMEVDETIDKDKLKIKQQQQAEIDGFRDGDSRTGKLKVALSLFANEMKSGFKTSLLRDYLLGTSASWFFSDILHCESKVHNVESTSFYSSPNFDYMIH